MFKRLVIDKWTNKQTDRLRTQCQHGTYQSSMVPTSPAWYLTVQHGEGIINKKITYLQTC